jgi:iron complex transport system substrate-binding protein
MKICSLLPGATEVVAALGATGDLVGITHECDYPPEVRTKPVLVRPTIDADRRLSHEIDREVKAAAAAAELYALDLPLFARLQPDLIITQDLCHVCAVTPTQLQRAVATLPAPPRILSLNPVGLDDVIADVERIGEAIGRTDEARAYAGQLRARVAAVRERAARAARRPRVACLEWLDPLYVGGHWVPEMVAIAGGLDALAAPGAPSRRVEWEEVLAAAPDVLVLMPCSFTIERTLREVDRVTSRPGWESLPAVKADRVFVVDSSGYFSRPSPRLVDGVAVLAALLHPDLFGPLPACATRLGPGPAR